MPLGDADMDLTDDLRKARVLIEKKTVINLLEAFSVAVKHYLRGEDGIYYTDLYYLVKYLPAYALPAGMPSSLDNREPFSLDGAVTEEKEKSTRFASSTGMQQGPQGLAQRPLAGTTSMSAQHLPLSSPSTGPPHAAFLPPLPQIQTQTPHTLMSTTRASQRDPRGSLALGDDGFLLPARDPPKWYILDLFPFSVVEALTKRGIELKGRMAAKVRAKRRGREVSHNLPLEISLYLVSGTSAPRCQFLLPDGSGV
jgi:ion channel-forming bestrophin family protein